MVGGAFEGLAEGDECFLLYKGGGGGRGGGGGGEREGDMQC